MTRQRLRIGRFSFSNLFPIFHELDRIAGPDRYQFVEGVPSHLNREIREGTIDISPSSSIEYLKNPGLYHLIPNHSISATGPVRSILLFSRNQIDQLEGKVILTTSHSETSVLLLEIMLKKFYGINTPTRSASGRLDDVMKTAAAYLLIGDEALSAAASRTDYHTYDLGKIWHDHTGMPFTYALWLMRSNCCADHPELLAQFIDDLDEAKASARSRYREIAPLSPLAGILPVEDIVAYWEGITYDFGPKQQRGLDLFAQLARELSLL